MHAAGSVLHTYGMTSTAPASRLKAARKAIEAAPDESDRAIARALVAEFGVSLRTACNDVQKARKAAKPAPPPPAAAPSTRGSSAAKQIRVEDLASRIGMGPITAKVLVRQHAARHGVSEATAWHDHGKAGAVLIELSKDRVALNHGLMESHLTRTIDVAEEAYRGALAEYGTLAARVRAVAELAAQAFDDGDDEEAGQLWRREERLEVRAVAQRNSAANMLRSMAPAQSRLMKLQGLGRPETMADVVDTLIQFADLPLPVSYAGPALPAGDDLSEIEVVDAEFTDAT